MAALYEFTDNKKNWWTQWIHYENMPIWTWNHKSRKDALMVTICIYSHMIPIFIVQSLRMALQVFCRTTVHVHIAAESWAGSRSWQGGDRDKSLIYWVHFLVSQAASNTPLTPIPTHPNSKRTEGEKQKVWSEGVQEEWGKQREREREKRLVKNGKWRQRQIRRDVQGTKRKIEPYWGKIKAWALYFFNSSSSLQAKWYEQVILYWILKKKSL